MDSGKGHLVHAYFTAPQKSQNPTAKRLRKLLDSTCYSFSDLLDRKLALRNSEFGGQSLSPSMLLGRLGNPNAARRTDDLHRLFRVCPRRDKHTGRNQAGSANTLAAMYSNVLTGLQLGGNCPISETASCRDAGTPRSRIGNEMKRSA
jgi:hypothetical protein